MTVPLARFSLLTQPWIRCQLTDGKSIALSIKDIFNGEHEVREIRGDSPAQDYAVLRVLLSVFWRSHRKEAEVGPGEVFSSEDWITDALAEAATGEPDIPVLDYLDDYAHRFELLDPDAPFMQVSDLRTAKDSRLPIRRIIPEAEDDYFTMRAASGRESLSFAEAARWLIYAQAYDYSGIKSGAVGDSRVKGGKGYPIGTGWAGMTGGSVIEGRTLRETLVLNTATEVLHNEEDRPVWERQPDTAQEREDPAPKGAADLATWQSRRIRLYFDDEKVTEVLVSNGDRIPDAGANIFGDPMTPYRYSSNKSNKTRKIYYPRPYDENRTMWRSLEPLIALESDPGFTDRNVAPIRPATLTQVATLSEDAEAAPDWVNLRLVSVAYGPQASSVATTVSTRIEIPVALLKRDAGQARRTLLDNAKATSDAVIGLGSFAGMLLVASGGEYEFQPPPTDTLLTKLEPEFISWLGHLEVSDLERHAAVWQRRVRRAVLDDAAVLMRGAGPKALVGREVTQSGGATGITSAGTAYRWLQRKLDSTLPLAKPEMITEKS